MICDVPGCEQSTAYECSYCSGDFCTDHRLPERHSCPRINVATSPGENIRRGTAQIAEPSKAQSRTKECASCATVIPADKEHCRRCQLKEELKQSAASSPNVALDGSIDRAEDDDRDLEPDTLGLSRFVPSISLGVIWIRFRGWIRTLMRLGSVALFLGGLFLMATARLVAGFLLMMVGLGLAYRWIVSDRVGTAATH